MFCCVRVVEFFCECFFGIDNRFFRMSMLGVWGEEDVFRKYIIYLFIFYMRFYGFGEKECYIFICIILCDFVLCEREIGIYIYFIDFRERFEEKKCSFKVL